MKDILKKGQINFGLKKTGKKFENDSLPTPNLQDKKIFDFAFKATFTSKKK